MSKRIILFIGCIALLISVFASSTCAIDADNDGMEDGYELSLAEKYAPILYFEKHEHLFPVKVEYHILNSNLNITTDEGEMLIDASPLPQQLGAYNDVSENYSLDNRKGGIYDDRIINDYEENMDSLGYTIYAHVFTDGNNTIIQYWMFYAFNKGTLNNHEGDWEMVQIVISNDTPVDAMYSQHISGQRAAWGEVEKEGEHIKVYVARGSHANYFRYFQGLMGLARDRVGKNGKILGPEDYNLVLLGERGEGNHNASQNWIDFAGRWGEFGNEESGIRGERGPYGPAYRQEGEMWYGTAWGYSLPSVHKGMLLFEWFVYHFVAIYLLIFLASLLFVAVAIYRRHRKYGIRKPYSPLFSINGFNMRSISSLLALVAIFLALLSLFYPWYGVFANVNGDNEMERVKIISIDGMHGIEVNLLKAEKGVVQVGALPIPFSLMIGASIILFVIATIGLERRKTWRKYMARGIKFMIPVFLIVLSLFILQMVAVRIGEAKGIENAGELMKEVNSKPFGGASSFMVEDYGEVKVEWGMQTGAYLLLVAGVAMILAAILSYGCGRGNEGEEK